MIFSHRHISLELRVGADRDTELQEMLEDEAHSPFNYVLENLSIKTFMAYYLGCLLNKEKLNVCALVLQMDMNCL